MLLNQFDCLIIIEGNRGLGKSTLAWHIAKKVMRIFRKITLETGREESPYNKHHLFKPHLQVKGKFKSVLYKREDVINFFDKWNSTAIADEMINVAFNREFWNEDQKNLIKMINMNRDHCNLFIMCIPQFQVLDNQMKNLCKIRITVARRGMAVIQTPNRTIYNKDKWDTANNERIEREWLKKGSGIPQYAKLNTFRGMMKFPKLNKRDQDIYDKIKVNERNVIKKSLGVTDEGKKPTEPFDIIYNQIIEGKVRNSHILAGFALANDIPYTTLRERIRRRLNKEQRPTDFSEYYWDKKAKEQEQQEEFASIA